MNKVRNIVLPEVRGEYKYHESLKKYTRLNVGGAADVLYFPADEADLSFFLQHKPHDEKVFVLGGGSNLLVRDGGISGVVIKLKSKNFSDCHIEKDCLYVGAGMQNNALRKILVENELGGLEFLCSIPGCVGGLLRTNAGCFGADTAAVLQKARVVDGNGTIFEVPASEFAFGYRSSIFPADWIVLGVYLKYQKATKEQIEAVIQQNAEYRKTHQPQNVRTAGSTFKNPEGYKAWQLIKESGADKLQIGGARMSPQHCNFLVNDGTATAKDIEDLMEAVTRTVKAHSGIELVSEIKIVGNR